MTPQRTLKQPLARSVTLAADAVEQATRARTRLAGTRQSPAAAGEGDLAADAAMLAAAARMRIVTAAQPTARSTRQRRLARVAAIYRRAMQTLFEVQRSLPVGTLAA